MMGGFRNCWPLCSVILILSVSCCCNLSEARHHRHKPSAVVIGAVYCDTCFQDDNSRGSHYISGATVAVECAEGSTRPAFHQEVKTDKQGKFKVALPFSVSKHVKKIEGCTVKLVKSSEPYCAVASTATSSLIHLKERKGRNHVFSAGYFTFKPLKQPGLCNQQPSVTESQLYSLGDLLNPTNPSFPTPTLPDPNPPTLANPNLPMPNVPFLPPLPPLPKLPNLPLLPPLATKTKAPLGSSKDSKVDNGFVTQPQQLFPPIVPPVLAPPPGPIPLPPNPLQPAPLLPNPLQPPAPPLIPNPLQPPTTPPGLLPPIPGLTPPTTPPGLLPPIPGLTPPTPPRAPPGLLPPIPLLPPFPGLTPPPAPTPQPPGLPLVPGLPIPPIIPLPPGLPLVPGLPPAKPTKVNP